MKQTIYAPNTVPTAHIAVNKGRLKIYKNEGSLPTYYLQKGQEFQIELANPTKDVVLAKITLNGRLISQGGLVLNPGQRVFLERYIDVEKKFLFDTYEVSNSKEMKKAIEDNGDIKIEFYREQKTYFNPITTISTPYYNFNDYPTYNIFRCAASSGTANYASGYAHTTKSFNAGDSIASASGTLVNGSNSTYTSNLASMDSLNDEQQLNNVNYKKKLVKSSLSKKSIETGRVEEGSHSDQKFRHINKDFEYFAFHTVEYKMLPVSQKINTVKDINLKRFCTNCGAKLGKTDKFCSTCGTKA